MMGAPMDLSQERVVSGRWSSLEGWVDLDKGRRGYVLKLGIQMALHSANSGAVDWE